MQQAHLEAHPTESRKFFSLRDFSFSTTFKSCATRARIFFRVHTRRTFCAAPQTGTPEAAAEGFLIKHNFSHYNNV